MIGREKHHAGGEGEREREREGGGRHKESGSTWASLSVTVISLWRTINLEFMADLALDLRLFKRTLHGRRKRNIMLKLVQTNKYQQCKIYSNMLSLTAVKKYYRIRHIQWYPSLSGHRVRKSQLRRSVWSEGMLLPLNSHRAPSHMYTNKDSKNMSSWQSDCQVTFNLTVMVILAGKCSRKRQVQLSVRASNI